VVIVVMLLQFIGGSASGKPSVGRDAQVIILERSGLFATCDWERDTAPDASDDSNAA
jgi:hypothetical protein